MTNDLVYREFSNLPADFVALTGALDRELRAKNGDAQDVYGTPLSICYRKDLAP